MIYAFTVLCGLTLAGPQSLVGSIPPAACIVFMEDDTTVAAFDVPPKIKVQSPVNYPESARQDKLQGDVILMMTISEDGNVFSVEVKKGVRKDLDAAAVKSARTWTFTPAEKDGKRVKAVVAVPVRFKLDNDAAEKTPKEGGVPAILERVPPTYPKEAIDKKIEGTVHVEMTVDGSGHVIEAKVLKSAHALLDKAALESARAWRFEATGGEPSSVVLPIRFKLSKEK